MIFTTAYSLDPMSRRSDLNSPAIGGSAVEIVNFVMDIINVLVAAGAAVITVYYLWWILKSLREVVAGRPEVVGGRTRITSCPEQFTLLLFPPPGPEPELKNGSCGVCLAEFEAGDVLRRLPSGLLLHHRCGAGEEVPLEFGWCASCRSSPCRHHQCDA